MHIFSVNILIELDDILKSVRSIGTSVVGLVPHILRAAHAYTSLGLKKGPGCCYSHNRVYSKLVKGII